MNLILGLFLTMICVLCQATELSEHRYFKELEFLFENMSEEEIEKVTHYFFSAHTYHFYLGCTVKEDDHERNHAGLLSSDWKRCYFMTSDGLKYDTSFFSLISNYQEQVQKHKKLLSKYYKGSSNWDFITLGPPCLRFVPDEPDTIKGFCLSNEADARWAYYTGLTHENNHSHLDTHISAKRL